MEQVTNTSERRKASRAARADILNLCVLIVGFFIMLLLVSPARSYPMFDDWAYAQATKSMLDGAYVRHDWAVATALVPIALGALLSLLGGYSFTTLTIANLFSASWE